MSNPQGKPIFRCRDDFGDIQVYESSAERQLYFDSRHKQSAMPLHDPNELCLPYFKTMMGALLFSQTPIKALVVGLGSGALVKFLYKHFEHCDIDVIEYRQKVIDIAHQFFAVPENPRVQIHNVDAGIFLHGAPLDTFADYDLILVDLFDSHGLSSAIAGCEFYDACRRRLSSSGTFSINLWGSDKNQFRENAQQIIHSFATQAVFIPAEDCGNIIGLGINQTWSASARKSLDKTAGKLKKQLGLDFNRFLKLMKQNNQDYFNQ